MYEAKVLTTKDEKEWLTLLEKTDEPDIYFTPQYVKIYEEAYSKEIDEAFCGPCFLFFFGNDEEFVIYPFLKRRINDLPFMQKEKSEDYFDIISPYGYNGPLVSCNDKAKEKKLVKDFLKAFDRFCCDEKIIAEFIRFHPILKNYEVFENYLKIDRRNTTVYVDLIKSEEKILAEMDRKTRNLMRKAEKKGIVVEESKKREDLKTFTNLYLETMEKNKASAKYLFPLEFYENTVKLLKDDITIFTAKYGGKIIAASMFMHKYGFLHYHFSGSASEYRTMAPNNLLLWKAILWGKKKGYKRFHLGGGNGKDDDLFRFKAGFSKDYCRFCSAGVIHDEKMYKQLCALKDKFEKEQGKTKLESDFFPYYRKIVEE
jgi:predicted N-acyltransferase